MLARNDNLFKKKIYKLKTLDDNIQNIVREAVEAREHAYSPYSGFKVGAAVLCADGKIYTGCNIENNSFGVGICAERCAYSKAISEGRKNFKAVVVVAYQEKYFTMPCGACRQFMSEFGNVNLYVTKPGCEEVFVSTLEEMLPFQFQTSNHSFD
ncbi:cytidine deaminase-like [Cylas formicarius]|uniref:cytidine deaminase-like n=1 Tax=Cylas formicarius TaxID=197179 RepID=UPI0029589F36|nr:cytidine deaminase-like [Cylas formicarius]